MRFLLIFYVRFVIVVGLFLALSSTHLLDYCLMQIRILIVISVLTVFFEQRFLPTASVFGDTELDCFEKDLAFEYYFLVCWRS